MKVLLVFPRSRHGFKHFGNIPPLGIAYVSSALRRDGHDVSIWDENVARARPDLGSFDVVGVSADTIRYRRGIEIAAMAKAAGARVIMGGSHVSFQDEETLRTGHVDVVVRNEAEDITRELLARFDGGGDLDPVQGVSFLRDGALVRNPDAPFPQDLDVLALPDREALGMHHYREGMLGQRPFTTMLASRGCPYSCEFCSSPRLSGRTRYRDPVLVVDEIEELVKRYKFGTIVFNDDIFTVNPKRTSAICDEIIARKLDVKFWCCSRVDTVMRQQELFEKMAAAGCYTIFLGIDGGTDEVLHELGKGYKADVAYDAIGYLHKLGIEVNAAFIIGGIQESREQMLKTIAYAKALKPDSAQFTINTPLPGSDLWDKVQERIEDREWNHYDLFHAVMRLDGVPRRKQVDLMLLRAYLSFYIFSTRGLANLGRFAMERLQGPKNSRSCDEPWVPRPARREAESTAVVA